jgi:glutamate-ammonia-ligase adenylyltransferase
VLVPPDLLQWLRILLPQSPDPEGALQQLVAFCRNHPAVFQEVAYAPFGLQALVAVFSNSRFLSEEVQQHPEWLPTAVDPHSLHRVQSAGEIGDLLVAFLESTSGVPLPLQLALFRRNQILRILIRDVLGFAALSEITEELTNLADAILDTAYRKLRAGQVARYGVPRLEETGLECGFSIIALGKLGARELNYSSDIDLMFVYDGPGETDGAQPISNKEFYKRVSNEITDVLGTYTSEGICYRVDLRLRPDGRLGEVCLSLDGTRSYYQQRARDWELQMLIKARVAAGEPAPGRALLEDIRPLIYSTSLDFSAIESMSLTRERITEKMNARRQSGGLDVKLARGGIRDIEFLVQCLQRLHGGREAWVRNSSTLLALVRLRDKDLLSDSEYSRLANAYQFLRQLEHRLQFDDDRQTHQLPDQPDELARVARRMPPGLLGEVPSTGTLLRELNAHLERVIEIYGRLVHAQQPMYYTNAPLPDHGPDEPPEKTLGAGEPVSNLVRYLDQHSPKLAAAIARARLGRNRSAFEHFLEAAAGRRDWLDALEQDPVLVGYLLDIFEHSPFLSEQLVRAPELFEEIRAVRLGSGSVPGEAFEWVEDASDLRKLYRRQMFRIIVESICLQTPIFATLEKTSLLADAAIAACYRLAVVQVRSHKPPSAPEYEANGQLMVIALGRLGMLEFDLGSDADLLFVLADEDRAELPFWTRVAERLVEILSSYTSDGVLFAVDTRLRPNGSSGALVQSEGAILEYFGKQAEAWEGLAYMKSRAISGDLERGTQFLAELQKVDWRRYGQSGRSKKELLSMRMRLEKEQGAGNPLKTSHGGYYDIDFALLYLRLRGAGMFFKVLNTPARVDVIEQMGHLERAEANFLRDAATFYRAVDHGLRVMAGHAEGSLPGSESHLETLSRLVSRWTPEHLHDQPLPVELAQIQQRTREVFDRLFDAKT